MKDGKWKDIQIINAEKLEEWLEIAPTIATWLATRRLGKYPPERIQSTDDFWEEWATGPDFNLSPNILLGGRENESKQLFNFCKEPNIISIQGISREEALAFIIASFKNDIDRNEDFFARSLIVDDIDSFRRIAVLPNPLILIPRFDGLSTFHKAIKNGHTVIVPLSPESSENWIHKIVLPRINRNSFIKSLISIGITEELAEKYSKESTRNLIILRRQLKFDANLPKWTKPEYVREIIPAMLAGSWDEDCEADRKIVSTLAREPYSSYSSKLSKWLNTSDSPFIKIGKQWRLASPLDTWSNNAKVLINNDFELLKKAFFEIISEVNPAFELEPFQRIAPSLYGKNMEFSENIRKGITQSLVLVSIFGNQLELSTPINSEDWVDSVVRELLISENPLLWKSISYYFNLIAEISPNEFLNAIERNLNKGKSPLTALFEEDSGVIFNTTYHVSLLWALEGLAWFPEYLGRVALILTQLIKFEDNISIANKPMKSLEQIFKPWHYQTLSNYQQRMNVLKLITKKEPSDAWTLLLKLLPSYHSAEPTYKMRWRMFDIDTNFKYHRKETYETYSYIIQLLISILDFSESQLSVLLKKSVEFNVDDRNQLLTYIHSNLSKIKQVDFSVWKTLREILSHHRHLSSARWALPESELGKYERLCDKLTPKNNIPELVWMFESSHPSIFKDIRQKDMSLEEEWKTVKNKRISTVKNIYDDFGIEKIIEIIEKVNEPSRLGSISAHIISDQEEVLKLCDFLKEKGKNLYFIQGFLYQKSILIDNNWTFNLFNKLDKKTFNSLSLARFVVALPPSQNLWNFINLLDEDIEKYYWLNTNSGFWYISLEERVFVIQKLIEVKRFIAAVKVCELHLDEIPTKLIAELLYKLGTEGINESTKIASYKVKEFFEALENKDDIDKNTMLRLEWLFLHFFNSFSSRRSPNLLFQEITQNPDFFNQLISWAYISKEESKISIDNSDLTQEQISFRADKALSLLNFWGKQNNIPGINEEGSVDTDFLWKWINETKAFAINFKNEYVADIYIGKVLAHYPEPEDERVWPPNEICEVIEKINTDALKANFSVALSNKYGGMRPATGGKRERNLAQYFQKLASYHRNNYPIVAGVLEDLAKDYARRGKREELRRELESIEH